MLKFFLLQNPIPPATSICNKLLLLQPASAERKTTLAGKSEKVIWIRVFHYFLRWFFIHFFFLITLHPNSIKFGFKRGEEIGIFNAFFLLKAKKSINPSLPLSIFFLFAGGISTHKNLLKNIFSFSPLSSLRCTGRCKC